ncbi:phage tail tape measure protein [Stappia sp.]|uniref:phage tail tape measure protein n=1 Tax=Stappia sp. TaxID=1870903 RepID=UPI0032D97FE1
MTEVHETSKQIGSTLAGALQTAVRGGERLDVVFKSIATSLSQWSLQRSMDDLGDLIGTRVEKIAGSFVSNFFATPSNGGSDAPMPFAKGGVVAAPTYFPLPGSASGTGLMGEAGAEAILPLSRDARGRLGVSALGDAPGGAPSIVFNVETRDAESFLRSEAQVATMVARAAGRGRRGL